MAGSVSTAAVLRGMCVVWEQTMKKTRGKGDKCERHYLEGLKEKEVVYGKSMGEMTVS